MMTIIISLSFFSCGNQDEDLIVDDDISQQESVEPDSSSDEESGSGGISGTIKLPSEDSSNVTTGERNALSTARDYLDYSSFSRSGLIDQLKYEGYSSSEAEYAVNNCGAHWKEQAVKTAQSYLDYSSFSRSGLIEQLVYEGYTREQAEYGVSQVY